MSGLSYFTTCYVLHIRTTWLVLLLCLSGTSGYADQDFKECAPGMLPSVLVYSELSIEEMSSDQYAVVVDKSRQTVFVFVFQGRWRLADKWPCSTGKKAGRKRVEGDYKTPVGVYFAMRRVPNRYLTETYGAFALPLNYPNWQDRADHRTGSAIWLHGTDGKLRSRDTNGCVVMENEYIVSLASFVQLKKTPIIIVERINWWRQKEADQWGVRLVDLIDNWQKDLVEGSYDLYQGWYTEGQSATMDWWNRWCRIRKAYGRDHGPWRLIARNVDIVRFEDLFFLQFQQELEVDGCTFWVGHRGLWVKLNGDKLRIVREVNTPGEIDTVAQSAKDPLFTAWSRLIQYRSKGLGDGARCLKPRILTNKLDGDFDKL
jgi:murein L,D-transpeptidase YafK